MRNRIVTAPMCQYSAEDGHATDWHLVHLGARAIGGAGTVMVEATAISPEARITPQCLGIWTDAQAEGLGRVARFISEQGAAVGIQLSHAGRKSSSDLPWGRPGHLRAEDPRAWEPIAPSAIAFGAHLSRVPRSMSSEEISQVRDDFVAAARRALWAGFQVLQLQFAHGYLAQSFFSPISNKRTDAYGASFENRLRFLVEVFDAVRAVWPERLPLAVRLGVSDFCAESHTIEESIEAVRALRDRGLDLADVSLAFNQDDNSGVAWGPAFLAPLAGRIRRETGVLTAVGWMITDAEQADAVIREGQADLVMIARRMLDDPHWAYHAGQALGVKFPHKVLPIQYAAWLRTQ
jgi:2,4-dienoyl-CoA reductase-like NADH-dependent reductase (Old Yellow Enzyme family)